MSDCIFCEIVKGDIPSDTVYENENVKVIKDINPVAPVHLVIIPKTHIRDMNGIDEDNSHIVAECMLAAKKSAETSGIDKSGYRIINNCGEGAGQTVMHIHFHLIGGVELGEGLI